MYQPLNQNMDNPKMLRSVSLPVHPNLNEPAAVSLKRSNEKEKVYSDNDNSVPYLYEADEFDDDDDDADHHHHHHRSKRYDNNNLSTLNDNHTDDQIVLNIDAEHVSLQRNSSVKTPKEIQINKSNYQQQRRRRHSSCCEHDGATKASSMVASYDTDTDIDISFADDESTHSHHHHRANNAHRIDECGRNRMASATEPHPNRFHAIRSVKQNGEESRIQCAPGSSLDAAIADSNTSSLKQRYKKDKRRSSNTRKTSVVGLGSRKNSQGWFGSTIEVNQDEANDSGSMDDGYERSAMLHEPSLRRSISRNINRRLIRKDGYQNVSFKNIPKRSLRYCKDLVTTLIELQWSYVLTIFVVIFIGSWILFALLWYVIAKAHGDLEIDEVTGLHFGEIKKPCVHGAYDMTAMFIHSLELQTTIGFGEKYPTEECPEGVFLFIFQIISSIAFEGAIVSVVYAKIAKPVKLLSKFTFSKSACVCLRDGKFCFIFRVCDPREQKCIGTKIRAYLVADATTPEGETMKVNTELKLEGDGCGIIIWPETVCHVIDSDSPFYRFTAIDFQSKNFEVFVSLVGHSPLTGQSTESRTSYLPHEILWGQRFPNIIDFSHVKESYVVDYNNFHTTIAANIPFKSPHHLDRLKL